MNGDNKNIKDTRVAISPAILNAVLRIRSFIALFPYQFYTKISSRLTRDLA